MQLIASASVDVAGPLGRLIVCDRDDEGVEEDDGLRLSEPVGAERAGRAERQAVAGVVVVVGAGGKRMPPVSPRRPSAASVASVAIRAVCGERMRVYCARVSSSLLWSWWPL